MVVAAIVPAKANSISFGWDFTNDLSFLLGIVSATKRSKFISLL